MAQDKSKSSFRKFISSDVQIIKNPDYFKITFTPMQILERKETFEFYREVGIFMKYKKPNNLLMKGFPGSGKTVTVNFVLQQIDEIKDNIDTLQVNCNDKSAVDVLKVLTDERSKSNFDALMKLFLTGLKRDTLIVMDEVDRSNKIGRLLYYLSRPTEMIPSFNKNISVVLISNNIHWEDNLKDSLRSSLQLKTVIFNPYTKASIMKILKTRIKDGFVNDKAISSDLIERVAEACVKERRGDCRVAIEAVFYAAQTAEAQGRRMIQEDDIRKALKIAISKSDKALVQKLKDNQLLVLYLVCSTSSRTLEEMHKGFVEAIRNEKLKIEPVTKVMVFHILNYLDDLCLINKKIEVTMENNIPRRSTQITCNVDRTTVLEELVIRGLRLSAEETIHERKSEVVLDNAEEK